MERRLPPGGSQDRHARFVSPGEFQMNGPNFWIGCRDGRRNFFGSSTSIIAQVTFHARQPRVTPEKEALSAT